MLVRPVSINGNLCKEFKSSSMEDLSVIVGGYIITPHGEIILVDENEEHCNVFSEYINSYLENDSEKIYETLIATKILCELGCCVYAGIRYNEYVSNKSAGSQDNMGSLTFPNDFNNLTKIQKEICLELISKNKSLLGDRDKIYIQYGSFPDNVYTKEDILLILNKDSKEMEL